MHSTTRRRLIDAATLAQCIGYTMCVLALLSLITECKATAAILNCALCLILGGMAVEEIARRMDGGK